jgi:hypothetical protein
MCLDTNKYLEMIYKGEYHYGQRWAVKQEPPKKVIVKEAEPVDWGRVFCRIKKGFPQEPVDEHTMIMGIAYRHKHPLISDYLNQKITWEVFKEEVLWWDRLFK